MIIGLIHGNGHCSISLQGKPQGYSGSESEMRGETSDSQLITEQSVSGSQALLEIAVRSGLSLIFALLRQNWGSTAGPGM